MPVFSEKQQEIVVKFLSSSDHFLEYLTKHYQRQAGQVGQEGEKVPTGADKYYVKKYFMDVLKSDQPLSDKLDLIQGLPDLDQEVLKQKKREIKNMVIDLEITMTSLDTLRHLENQVTHYRQTEKHSKWEQLFNKIYNDSQLVIPKDGNIYLLELEIGPDGQESLKDKSLGVTYYNHLPEVTSGCLKWYDMKISQEKYNALAEIDSSDEEDGEIDKLEEEYDITKRELITEIAYTSKSEMITKLQGLIPQPYGD